MNVTRQVALSLQAAAASAACTDDSHVTAPALAATTPLRLGAVEVSGFHVSAIAGGKSCC